jgi:hypothetical protein
MTAQPKPDELSQAQQAWLNTIVIEPPDMLTDAECIWYWRIANLPEDRWHRAINSTWAQSMAAKAAAPQPKKGWRR